MEDFREIWEKCVNEFGAEYLNESAVSFGFSFLKNYIKRDPLRAIGRFVYVVVSQHPLTDANKRCALCFLLASLEHMGMKLSLSQVDLSTLITNSARGEIKESDFVDIIRENSKQK